MADGENVRICRNFLSHTCLVRYEVDNLRKELGLISKTVAQKMKESKGADKCEEEKAQANAVKERIEITEK
jgi:hypothetical protein